MDWAWPTGWMVWTGAQSIGWTVWTGAHQTDDVDGARPIRWMVWTGGPSGGSCEWGPSPLDGWCRQEPTPLGRRCGWGPGLLDGRCGRGPVGQMVWTWPMGQKMWTGGCGADSVDVPHGTDCGRGWQWGIAPLTCVPVCPQPTTSASTGSAPTTAPRSMPSAGSRTRLRVHWRPSCLTCPWPRGRRGGTPGGAHTTSGRKQSECQAGPAMQGPILLLASRGSQRLLPTVLRWASGLLPASGWRECQERRARAALCPQCGRHRPSCIDDRKGSLILGTTWSPTWCWPAQCRLETQPLRTGTLHSLCALLVPEEMAVKGSLGCGVQILTLQNLGIWSKQQPPDVA